MKKGARRFFLVVFVCIIYFCLSFVVAVKFIIEPNYKFLSTSGMFDQISSLKTTIMEKEQTISDLQDQIEIYSSMLEGR